MSILAINVFLREKKQYCFLFYLNSETRYQEFLSVGQKRKSDKIHLAKLHLKSLFHHCSGSHQKCDMEITSRLESNSFFAVLVTILNVYRKET